MNKRSQPDLCVQSCEDLEDAESLRHLFDIVKSIIMLNDTNIMEALFSQENVMDMVSWPGMRLDSSRPAWQPFDKPTLAIHAG